MPKEATVYFLGDGEFDGIGLLAKFTTYGWHYICRTGKNVSVFVKGKKSNCGDLGAGLEVLRRHLKDCMGFQEEQAGEFIARRRHLDALARAYAHLQTGREWLRTQAAGELLAEDLRQAQNSLSEITGEFTADDLLGEIFSSFCIGK